MTPFDSLVLDSERLQLRPLVAHDAQALYAIFSDPRVMRYWSTPPWTQLAQAETRIADETEGMRAGRSLRLGLVRTSDDALLGTCSLFSFNEACRRAEIGYALARSAWGAGLMHEALQVLLRYAFGDLQLHRLEADIDPRNAASARSLERLGFVKEGHLRERWIVDGEVSDSALYGLLQSDWRAR
ncbi:MAG: GNAT family N-acetyltransferase [Burkholderiales bacterium]